ncbi:ABC transporter substrate-binding protein [Actinomadura rupiterrae]|uniref:ABC transporter substrate-binding protein n=1 Tax=Actinomadura rupiterrae TaxID=559627 RepID=UPI0020A5C2BA|nr:ABC transporter substrate-binding protein [Actinomadura rupiterrae]MCP2337614.1 NitT/TauT family transport system substrate-binding protein [Actinomadura rupiterrae]
MKRSLLGLAAAAACLALSACGSASGAGNPKGLEKPVLNVGVVPVPDSAPLAIAQQKGFFKDEGLTVRTRPIKASPEATPLLLNGSMDLALLNYVSTFTAQDKGAVSFRLVADSYQGANGSFALLTGKDSDVRGLAGLKGRKVAVPALKSITDLLLAVQLKSAGLDPAKDVTVVPVPLPNMGAALKQGTVDAVAAVEPFVTDIQAAQGGHLLADLVTGPTEEFPISGWGGTAKFAERNPKTVAAFQRAIAKALKVAADRDEVTRVIPTYTQIPAATAGKISLGAYPPDLDAAKLQKVAALMKEYGYLQNAPDVRKMIVAPPK